MARKSKYEDEDFIISELCKFYSDDDLLQMANINTQRPSGMSKEDFQHLYNKHLKLFYLRARQKGDAYEKVSFSELNKKIMQAIESKSQDKEYPLMPKEKSDADKVNRERIKALTASLNGRLK